jgi:nucleotide-binding universal stress UspA family protein
MHVLIATTGALPAAAAVEFTTRLLGGTGRATVTTVMEVPRPFLEELDDGSWHPLDVGDATHRPHEDVLVERYVEERGRKLTEPIANALNAAGIETDARFLEGSDPAKLISSLAEEIGADVIVLGATRQIFDDDAWESVSSRVMQESRRPILVLPAFARETPSPAADGDAG